MARARSPARAARCHAPSWHGRAAVGRQARDAAGVGVHQPRGLARRRGEDLAAVGARGDGGRQVADGLVLARQARDLLLAPAVGGDVGDDAVDVDAVGLDAALGARADPADAVGADHAVLDRRRPPGRRLAQRRLRQLAVVGVHSAQPRGLRRGALGRRAAHEALEARAGVDEPQPPVGLGDGGEQQLLDRLGDALDLALGGDLARHVGERDERHLQPVVRPSARGCARGPAAAGGPGRGWRAAARAARARRAGEARRAGARAGPARRRATRCAATADRRASCRSSPRAPRRASRTRPRWRPGSAPRRRAGPRPRRARPRPTRAGPRVLGARTAPATSVRPAIRSSRPSTSPSSRSNVPGAGRARQRRGLERRRVLAEDVLHRAADLAERGAVAQRVLDERQQVVGAARPRCAAPAGGGRPAPGRGRP